MDRYIMVYEWMQELGLKPGEMLAYAVIYSFGKDGDWFTGSASYLAKWIGLKKKATVYRMLTTLVSKGLLEKRERWEKGEKICDYRPVRKRDQGSPRNGRGGSPENGHHNNRPDSDSHNKEEIKNKEVRLTPDEWRKAHR